jgi:O-acetyl-ADP-ribose deacetylase
VFGWPLDDAARIAVETAQAHDPVSVQEVRFVLFNEQAYDAFAAHLRPG